MRQIKSKSSCYVLVSLFNTHIQLCNQNVSKEKKNSEFRGDIYVCILRLLLHYEISRARGMSCVVGLFSSSAFTFTVDARTRVVRIQYSRGHFLRSIDARDAPRASLEWESVYMYVCICTLLLTSIGQTHVAPGGKPYYTYLT